MKVVQTGVHNPARFPVSGDPLDVQQAILHALQAAKTLVAHDPDNLVHIQSNLRDGQFMVSFTTGRGFELEPSRERDALLMTRVSRQYERTGETKRRAVTPETFHGILVEMISEGLGDLTVAGVGPSQRPAPLDPDAVLTSALRDGREFLDGRGIIRAGNPLRDATVRCDVRGASLMGATRGLHLAVATGGDQLIVSDLERGGPDYPTRTDARASIPFTPETFEDVVEKAVSAGLARVFGHCSPDEFQQSIASAHRHLGASTDAARVVTTLQAYASKKDFY